MTVPVQAAGLTALKRLLADLPTALRAETNVALAGIAADVVAEARRLLAGSELSRPGGPGQPLQEPPAQVAAALGWRLGPEDASLTVTAASPRARALEYGTRTTAARPFLRPAVEAAAPDIRAAFRAAMTRAATTLPRGSA